MSKELVTHVWCDHHEQAKAEQVPGASHTITVDGLEVEIDLCAECEGPVLELRTWLEENGRVLKRGRATKAQVLASGMAEQCPECGKTLKGHKGVMSHMRNQHGLTLSEYLATGRQPALDEQAGLGTLCEECGRTFASRQGLATHQTRAGHLPTGAGESQ